MTRTEAEQKYRKMGLITRHIKDEPGLAYEPHRHGGVYLFTLSGSLRLKLDGKWQIVTAGQEIRIKDDQLHEAQVGQDGWEYVFAATAEEAKRQEL